ncbi:MAG: hypothetical protein ABJK59_09600 [Erythrobacter sp.]|uniref:hypothetical protein n=1 Tax=Erythrobacter sp. TaxID=1042 RepID=UPI0032979B8C
MNRAKWIWLVGLGLIYAGFWIWYGGNGDPLSEEEGLAMLAEVERVHGVKLEDTPEGSMSRNLRDMLPHDDGKEFYAVNLETRAEGPAALEAEADYAAIVMPLLLERGGHPVFVSERVGLMLGKYGGEVDRVAVVRYRSLRDLLDMIADEKMLEGNAFKTASLAHTEVFITRPTITFVQVRLMVGMVLALIAIAGVAVIGSIQARRAHAATT